MTQEKSCKTPEDGLRLNDFIRLLSFFGHNKSFPGLLFLKWLRLRKYHIIHKMKLVEEAFHLIVSTFTFLEA